MTDDSLQAVWNIDQAILYAIYKLKMKALDELNIHDLESLYWTLLNLSVELDAKLTDDQRTEIEKMNTLLIESRELYYSNKKDKEIHSNYWSICYDYYKHLCRLMKLHGLYFREERDPSKAVLRRG